MRLKITILIAILLYIICSAYSRHWNMFEWDQNAIITYGIALLVIILFPAVFIYIEGNEKRNEETTKS